MNPIAARDAKIAALDAEVEALRDSLRNLREFVLIKGYRDGRGGFIQVEDVSRFCEQAQSLASDVYSEAYYNVAGPRIASGGCAWAGRTTCTHEPSLRPNSYHCPLCATLLPGEWNDTPDRADERMYQHFRKEHRA